MLLPKKSKRDQKNIPVLYLLHGLFGSCENWLELTNLTNYFNGKTFALVFPDCGDNWYTDSAANELDKFETFFIEEFIPKIESTHKIGGKRNKRAIAGLSMGGYGAFKFALKRPDLFIFAGSMSGAFNAPQITKNSIKREYTELLPSIMKTFGAANSRTRDDNDLFKLVSRLPQSEIKKISQLYFDCGTEDVFLKANRELAKVLKERKINFEFNEVSGAHNWLYWDKQVQNIINLAEIVFKQAEL